MNEAKESFWNKFFVNDIAIDLGTANTLVYVKGRGILISMPEMPYSGENHGHVMFISSLNDFFVTN